MATKLTDSVCRAAEPGGKVHDLADAGFRGLLLRINPGGGKSWYYRWQRGRMVKLGTFPELNCHLAREAARAAMLKAMGGADLVEARREAVRPKDDGLTFSSFVEDHYLPHVMINHTKKGRNSIVGRLRKNWLPMLGNLSMDAINRPMIEAWRDRMKAEGWSAAHINTTIAILRSVLRLARDRGMMAGDPLVGIRLLRVDNSHVRYLTDDEEARLRAILDGMPRGSTMRCGIFLSMNTGLRAHELFHLEWPDVDMDGQMLKVLASTAKSGRARYIPLNDEAMAILEELQAAQNGPMVLHHGGKPYLKTELKGFKDVLKQANIVQFRWHDLRHHFASRLDY